MAKPLSAKSRLIRDAISAHPKLKNKKLAEMINGSADRQADGIEVKPTDVAQQRQAMKSLGSSPPPRSTKPRIEPQVDIEEESADMDDEVFVTAEPPTTHSAAAATAANPIDLIDKVYDLAKDCGGFEQLERLVERLARMRGT